MGETLKIDNFDATVKNSEYDSINPEKLIVQEGEDAGRISEKPLAEIGAYAEDGFRGIAVDLTPEDPSGKITTNRVADIAGERAMKEEISKRAGDKFIQDQEERAKENLQNK